MGPRPGKVSPPRAFISPEGMMMRYLSRLSDRPKRQGDRPNRAVPATDRSGSSGDEPPSMSTGTMSKSGYLDRMVGRLSQQKLEGLRLS